MTSLLEMQRGFRLALLQGDADAIAGMIANDGLPPDARLQIHVNHVFATLTDALAVTFPVVRRLVGEGLKNKQIAERLVISEATVRHHLTSIFSKLGVTDRFELVIYAYRYGLAKLR